MAEQVAEWGTRERLDAWLDGCRRDGELGTSVRIDFELVKEALTEIDRLRKELKHRDSRIHYLKGCVEDLSAALEKRRG